MSFFGDVIRAPCINDMAGVAVDFCVCRGVNQRILNRLQVLCISQTSSLVKM